MNGYHYNAAQDSRSGEATAQEEMYAIRTEHFEHTVSVEEYMEKCVDVEEFLRYCKECRNYGNVWSCPPYDFDPEDYWKKYSTFRIVGVKIYLPEELLPGTYTEEEREEIFERILYPKKEELNQELFALEKDYPGSVSLSGGSCRLCIGENGEGGCDGKTGEGGCARKDGAPCRYPEQMRYSIESLGGNVGLTVTRYLHQELQWIEEGKLPEYFMLVGGLLLP